MRGAPVPIPGHRPASGQFAGGVVGGHGRRLPPPGHLHFRRPGPRGGQGLRRPDPEAVAGDAALHPGGPRPVLDDRPDGVGVEAPR